MAQQSTTIYSLSNDDDDFFVLWRNKTYPHRSLSLLLSAFHAWVELAVLCTEVCGGGCHVLTAN